MSAVATATEEKKKLLRLRDVCSAFSISRTAVYRLMAANKFPRSVDSGAGPRWRVNDLERWANGLRAG
jgi:predicted DNA-binding transcriptional regulator AlpA